MIYLCNWQGSFKLNTVHFRSSSEPSLNLNPVVPCHRLYIHKAEWWIHYFTCKY